MMSLFFGQKERMVINRQAIEVIKAPIRKGMTCSTVSASP